MKILVIEDEKVIYEWMERSLADLGHPCIVACNTGEADLALQTANFDAITLDLGLGVPGRNTVTWLEELALTYPAIAERTLVVTGGIPSVADEARILKTGATLLLKPFSVDQLEEWIESLPPKPKKSKPQRESRVTVDPDDPEEPGD